MRIVDKVKALLESDVSRYQISQDTGIDQAVLSRLANGKTDLGAVSIDRGQMLADYYDAMILNIAIDGRNLPINGDSDAANELRKFAPKFNQFGQEVYEDLVEDGDEFADAFRSLFDDAMQDTTIRSRAMLAWIDSNFK